MTDLTKPRSRLARLYPKDFEEQQWTRAENEQILMPVIDQLSSGNNIEQLERFAKAYLGMYLDLDNSIPPRERIEILTSPLLAGEIERGFMAVMQHHDFPSPEQIADSIFSDDFPEGYILLAALDLHKQETRTTIQNLPSRTLMAAICFHYAYQTEIQDEWLNTVMLHRGSEASQALTAFWLRMIEHGTDHLPGLYRFIEDKQYDDLSKDMLLPVLQNWRAVNKKVLRKLLLNAIRTTDHKTLLGICESSLESWNFAEPARYVLWLATAFLLEPDTYAAKLVEYCGRTKEKIIPLMDFVYLVLQEKDCRVDLDTNAISTLIRIIAPKVTPQEDRYGQLCDNTRKVMYLFYRFATAAYNQEQGTEMSITALKQVRVLKLYTPILDFISAMRESAQPDTNSARHRVKLEFTDFLNQLLQAKLIRGRIKRYD